MSVWAYSWAFEQPIEKTGAKFVLVALANFADEKGRAYPSQATLAAMTGMTDRAVRGHLAWLEQEEFIERHERRDKSGQRTSDICVLLAPENRLRPPAANNAGSDEPTGKKRQHQPEKNDSTNRKSFPGKRQKEPSVEPSYAASGQKLKANDLMSETVDLCTAAEFEVFDYQKRAWAGEFRRLIDQGTERKRIDAIQEVIQAQAEDGVYCSVKQAKKILDGEVKPHDKHESNAKEEATPREGLARLEGHSELSGYAELAKRFDFSSTADPPWQVMNRLGGTSDEQYRNLTRIRSVVGTRAKEIDAEHERMLDENQRMLDEMLEEDRRIREAKGKALKARLAHE